MFKIIMETNILFLAIICYVIIGFSHLLQPQAWINFFKLLLKHQRSGSFINGFITLPMGVLIVSFHNVWVGLNMLLTILGWCYILKATIAFCFPAISLRSMKRVEKNNVAEFRIAGVIMILIAGVLSISFFD